MPQTAQISIKDRIILGRQQLLNTYNDLTPEQLATVLTVRSKSTGQTKQVTVRELLGIIAIYLEIFDNLNNQANEMKRFIYKELQALNSFKEVILKTDAKKSMKTLDDLDFIMRSNSPDFQNFDLQNMQNQNEFLTQIFG